MPRRLNWGPLTRLGNHALPHRQRGERAHLQLLARVAQECHDIGVVVEDLDI
jgi:hypothetical protein